MADYRSLWAQRIVRETLFKELQKLSATGLRGIEPPSQSDALLPLDRLLQPPNSPLDLPHDPAYEHPGRGAPRITLPKPFDVCIVGAGIAGLYIALILDDLAIPNLSYQILEASDRVGGRVYTHDFSKTKHDYYDAGAMRFPKIPTMDRTFELFDKMQVRCKDYYLHGVNCPRRFNDNTVLPTSTNVKDPFKVSQSNGGNVPDDVVDDVGNILESVFGPYKEKMKHNFEEGFQELLTVDDYSTREYLKRRGKPSESDPNSASGYDFPSIQWMETQNTASGLFDQAFTESVMDSFDFSYSNDVNWYCIEGGTSRVTDAMRLRIENNEKKIELDKRVTAIGIDGENMYVQCAGEKERRRYLTVFNTTTLGCLQRMDLTGLGLHPSQKDAIRCLNYDHSVKVAIKFQYPWWRTKCDITKGGVASTDLPLRTCVYPSYDINDPDSSPSVLLVSYTWAQDATRMSSLFNNGDSTPSADSELIELLLYDLWRLHSTHIKSVDELRDAYLGHHAFSWTHNPNTAGAFALFGPGQFSHLYPYLSRPAADSRFHIVGEASSANHAWIVGALNSAYMAVHRFLYRFRQYEYIEKLEENWGTVGEFETGAKGTEHLQVALGMLKHEASLE